MALRKDESVWPGRELNAATVLAGSILTCFHYRAVMTFKDIVVIPMYFFSFKLYPASGRVGTGNLGI